jgi:hypothetical protein
MQSMPIYRKGVHFETSLFVNFPAVRPSNGCCSSHGTVGFVFAYWTVRLEAVLPRES